MSRAGDERTTKVYLRCEACGKIAVPQPDGNLPDGWISLGPAPGFNASRAVCSADCRDQVSQRPR
jgi:hypothetical protein